jgi:hypothetical protein
MAEQRLRRGARYPVRGPRTTKAMQAEWSGEMRPPRAGEWFLSGAIIEAYQTKNDLTAPYPIARLV